MPESVAASDPGPEETAKRRIELVRELGGTPAGVVGFAEGGQRALELALTYPELIDRLVLVSVEPSEAAPTAVGAKTLLLYGSFDGGQRRATWWKNRIGGRIEMVPGEGRDILEHVWPRVLSHLAPGSASGR